MDALLWAHSAIKMFTFCEFSHIPIHMTFPLTPFPKSSRLNYVLMSKPSQSSLPPSPRVFSPLTTSLSTQSRWMGSPPEAHLLGEGPLTPVFWCHLLEQPMFLLWPYTEPAQPWTKLSLLYPLPRNPPSQAAIGYGAWVRDRHRAAMADDPGSGPSAQEACLCLQYCVCLILVNHFQLTVNCSWGLLTLWNIGSPQFLQLVDRIQSIMGHPGHMVT